MGDEGSEAADEQPEGLGFHGADIRLSDPWEWIEWQCGTIGGDCGNLSFREITQRFEGKRYFDMTQTAELIAGFYNANGGLKNNRLAKPSMFHPHHCGDETQEQTIDGDLLIAGASASLGLVDVKGTP